MNWLRIFFVFLSAQLFFATKSDAAEFSYADLNGLSIVVEGEIEQGDAESFVEMVRGARGRVRNVFLYSGGGNLYEAMRIGGYIRDLALTTYSAQANFCAAESADNCICASACFFVHAGGVGRYGANLIVHRPYFDPEQFSELSFSSARQAYDTMLADSQIYLDEMGVPNELIEAVYATPSSEILDISLLGRNSQPIERQEPYLDYIGPTPELEHWVEARCGSTMESDHYVWFELYQNSRGAWSNEESRNSISEAVGMVFEDFLRIGTERMLCESAAMRDAQIDGFGNFFGRQSVFVEDPAALVAEMKIWRSAWKILGAPVADLQSLGWNTQDGNSWVAVDDTAGPVKILIAQEDGNIRRISLEYEIDLSPSLEEFTSATMEETVSRLIPTPYSIEILEAHGNASWGEFRLRHRESAAICLARGILLRNDLELNLYFACEN